MPIITTYDATAAADSKESAVELGKPTAYYRFSRSAKTKGLTLWYCEDCKNQQTLPFWSNDDPNFSVLCCKCKREIGASSYEIFRNAGREEMPVLPIVEFLGYSNGVKKDDEEIEIEALFDDAIARAWNLYQDTVNRLRAEKQYVLGVHAAKKSRSEVL